MKITFQIIGTELENVPLKEKFVYEGKIYWKTGDFDGVGYNCLLDGTGNVFMRLSPDTLVGYAYVKEPRATHQNHVSL